ncbi:T9SS type A sorting domain-containing protein [Flavobacterium album]|nr:T9SS type A sorting domain-containing protein [Flavobacterium album]
MNKLIILLLFPAVSGFSQTSVGSINSGSNASNTFSGSVGVIYVVPENPDRISSGTLGAVTQIVLDALDTNDFIVAEGITYYPNPVQDYLTFEAKGEINLSEMQIRDAKGSKITIAPANGNRIDLSSLTTGIYFMSFPNTNIKPVKIVKN